MAAFNDSGLPRKRIATYGKVVRKRFADHVAFKALQDLEAPSGAPRAASVFSASTESIINDSPPSPSSSPSNLHIFDVPSGDDDAVKGQKKRKLVHVARTLPPISTQRSRDLSITALQHGSKRVVEQRLKPKESIEDTPKHYEHGSRRPQIPPKKVRSGPEKSKILEVHRSEKTSSTHTAAAPKRDTRIETGRSPSSQLDRAYSNHPPATPSGNSSSQVTKILGDTSTKSHKRRAATNVQRPSRRTTPEAMDCEPRDANMSLSASSILTPKGAKMWNDLLGEDNNDLRTGRSERSTASMQHSVKEHQSSGHPRKLPRRRLIDTLVEQSRNPKSILDLFPDMDEGTVIESDLAPYFQVAENDQPPSAHLADTQKSPGKASNLNKAVGLGPVSQILGAKITYSRQRSMLAEQDVAKEINFDIPLHDSLPGAKLQNKRGLIPVLAPLQSLHESSDFEDGNAGVAIRTIHELRQAGAESRFKDELEDILDRVGKPGAQNATRRSGLLELAEKMRDKMFYTKFISNGLDQRLFLHSGQEKDVISGFVLVSLLVSVLEAGITLMVVTQLRRQGITRLLTRLLSVDDSILVISKARTNNMSRVAQAMLMELHQAFLQSRAWGDLRPQTVSPRTASLRCLELMVRQSRDAGDTGDVISKELVSNLFTILKRSAAKPEAVDFQLALSTLASHSSNPITSVEEFLPVMRDVLQVTMQNPPDKPTVILLLRFVLNTTNNSPAASDAFASPELLHLMCCAVIEKFRTLSGFMQEDKRLVLVDHLVLVLVVMINIAELSVRARQCFLVIQDSSLESLVTIFQDNIERAFEADSVEDSHLNVAGGYLAVLLGCLSLSPEIGERIRSKQRTPSLRPLITCIDEFVSHHEKVDALLKDEGEHNPQAGLTDRLQNLVDKLKEMNSLQRL